MPNNDKTGPLGEGPLTGQGQGICNGDKPSVGGRFVKGTGMGRGNGNRRASCGRPRGCRRMGLDPKVFFYKPQGTSMTELQAIDLTHEEWEALRLKHSEDLNQVESSKEMETSQSTLQRILASAHKKIGKAIVEGLAIKIVKE